MKYSLMRKKVVFVFHNIQDANWFITFLQFIRKYFKIITLEDFESRNKNTSESTPVCALTFDDGYLSFYKIVFPILKDLGIPATLFVSPTRILQEKNFWFQDMGPYNSQSLKKIIEDYLKIGNGVTANYGCKNILKSLKIYDIEEIINEYKRRHLTENANYQLITHSQTKEMSRSDVITFGAHTNNHPILANEDDATALMEIKSSINELSTMIGQRIKYFAYPNGIKGLDFGQREINLLKVCEISLGFSTLNMTYNKSESHYEIPRIGLSYGSTMFTLSKIIMGGHWDKLKGGESEKKQRHKIRKMIESYR